MKVYLCYEVYFNYCDEFSDVVKIFDDELKALAWVDEVVSTETEWRCYVEQEVE